VGGVGASVFKRHTLPYLLTMLPRPLTFLQRILWALLALGVLPTSAVLVSWALTLQNGSTTEAMRTAGAATGTSGRILLETLDTTRLSHTDRKALADHAAALNSVLSRSQQISS